EPGPEGTARREDRDRPAAGAGDRQLPRHASERYQESPGRHRTAQQKDDRGGTERGESGRVCAGTGGRTEEAGGNVEGNARPEDSRDSRSVGVDERCEAPDL